MTTNQKLEELFNALPKDDGIEYTFDDGRVIEVGKNQGNISTVFGDRWDRNPRDDVFRVYGNGVYYYPKSYVRAMSFKVDLSKTTAEEAAKRTHARMKKHRLACDEAEEEIRLHCNSKAGINDEFMDYLTKEAASWFKETNGLTHVVTETAIDLRLKDLSAFEAAQIVTLLHTIRTVQS